MLRPRVRRPRSEAVSPAALAAWRATPLGDRVERLEVRLVLDLLGPLAGRELLDVGCGDGTYLIEASRLGAQVVGLDRDAAMIEAAKRRLSEAGAAAAVVTGDALDLPFADASFDAVCLVTVLCMVDRPDAAVREAARVLRPGGLLVLGELGRWSTWAVRCRVRGWLGASVWRSARFWGHGDLRALVRGAGLTPESFGSAVHFPPSGALARLIGPVDRCLGRRSRGIGAAFLAVRARRPG